MLTIVMLTKGKGTYPFSIARRLNDANCRLSCIVRCTPPSGPGLLSEVLRVCRQEGLGALGQKVYRRLGRQNRQAQTKNDNGLSHESPLRKLADRYIDGISTNSTHLQETLRSTEPDLLILGGVGILDDSILQIPRIGTLNVHPGLLPFFRGVGVVGRAVLHEFPVGVTAHYVDPGIDTGPILVRRIVPVADDDTLDRLQGRAVSMCADVMAEIVIAMNAGKDFKPLSQRERYRMSRWLTNDEKERVNEILKSGVSLKLYEQWKNRDVAELEAPPSWPPRVGSNT